MTNTNPLHLMQELGIDKGSYRVLGLLPLVYIAWADGQVQRRERALILKTASDKGWLEGGGERILERWLAAPPTPDEVDKGLTVLRLLARKQGGVGASIHHDTLVSLVAMCRDVAEAAGNAWGQKDTIAREEASALENVARSLGIADGKTWGELADEGSEGKRAVAPGPKGRFLIGSALEFAANPVTFLTKLAREHGDIAHFRVAGLDAILVTRPEHVEYVLVENADNYLRGADFETIARLAGSSILTTEGDAWRRLRRIAQPAFRKDHIANMQACIVRIAEEMVARWEPNVTSGKPIDVAQEMVRITLQVIGMLMCNRDFSDASSHLGSAVKTAMHFIAEALANPLRFPLVVPTPTNVRFREAVKVFDEFMYGIIRERRAETTAQHDDLLGLLMSAKDEATGEGLTDTELRNELLTFLVAGHETTAVAMTWTAYLLSKHPGAARTMRAEVDRVLGGKPPTAAQLSELTYTSMVLEESLRLYPPFYASSRAAVSEDSIGGYRIPKGTIVITSMYVTHHHPSVWENPEGFDPERFTEENVAKRHRMAHFPFFAGPHKCIGLGLAYMEMKIFLPMILQRYRLDLLPGHQVELDAHVTLRPKGGLPMTVHRRS